MSYQHKDTPESFWERMRMIHGDEVAAFNNPRQVDEPYQHLGKKWMEIKIIVPEDEGKDILTHLHTHHGFKQIDDDWCTDKRKGDVATVDYAPCEEPRDRRTDW